MNSRDRYIISIKRKPVDHIPLYLRIWDLGNGVDKIPFNWRDQVIRAENLLSLGIDDTLLLEPPLGYPEEYIADKSQQVDGVKTELVEYDPLTKTGIIKKQYDTPAGDLVQIVKTGENWPHGKNIMLFSDHNISGYIEPIIKSKDDVSRLKHLLARPTDSQIAEFWEISQRLHAEAGRLEVALEGGWSALGDSVMWLCGMENVLYWQMDHPDLIESLLDVLLEWELGRVDYLLEAGIDIMVHMAWYEGTDFWTPKNYRKMIKPRLQEIIDKVHAYNIPFRYIITKAWWPLRHDLMDMGIDCITGVDPVQDNVDLRKVKEEIGTKIALMGGMNAALTLNSDSEAEIRDAVKQAMYILSPGSGFILFPVDNFACEWPWVKAEIIIEEWKKHW